MMGVMGVMGGNIGGSMPLGVYHCYSDLPVHGGLGGQNGMGWGGDIGLNRAE